jgi:hypothetical protein
MLQLGGSSSCDERLIRAFSGVGHEQGGSPTAHGGGLGSQEQDPHVDEVIFIWQQERCVLVIDPRWRSMGSVL